MNNDLLSKNIESLTLIRKLKKLLISLDDDRRYKTPNDNRPSSNITLSYIELTSIISMVTRLEVLLAPKAQLPKYAGKE